MWDAWKNCKPGLQFFHVSHISEITLIRCHSPVISLYVFAVWQIGFVHQVKPEILHPRYSNVEFNPNLE